MYFVLPKPLQNSPKTTSARRSSRAVTAALPRTVTTPPTVADAPPAGPLRRRRCRFGLVDPTWVWSKVVVA